MLANLSIYLPLGDGWEPGEEDVPQFIDSWNVWDGRDLRDLPAHPPHFTGERAERKIAGALCKENPAALLRPLCELVMLSCGLSCHCIFHLSLLISLHGCLFPFIQTASLQWGLLSILFHHQLLPCLICIFFNGERKKKYLANWKFKILPIWLFLIKCIIHEPLKLKPLNF